MSLSPNFKNGFTKFLQSETHWPLLIFWDIILELHSSIQEILLFSSFQNFLASVHKDVFIKHCPSLKLYLVKFSIQLIQLFCSIDPFVLHEEQVS